MIRMASLTHSLPGPQILRVVCGARVWLDGMELVRHCRVEWYMWLRDTVEWCMGLRDRVTR